MGGSHARGLHLPGDSPVHRLPAQTKLVALVAFVLVVVTTPGSRLTAFAAYAVALAAVAALARVPAGHLLKGLVVEAPFVVFALFLPLVAVGPRVQVGPLGLSESGLHAALTLVLKGTLGVMASVLLATTTSAGDLLTGLERLRLPRQLVQIMAFMLRYVDVVADQLRRLRVARESRGFRTGDIRSWPVLGATLGTLFIRSFERGERVHLAMLSRGYAGSLPTLAEQPASAAEWVAAGMLPFAALAALLATTAW